MDEMDRGAVLHCPTEGEQTDVVNQFTHFAILWHQGFCLDEHRLDYVLTAYPNGVTIMVKSEHLSQNCLIHYLSHSEPATDFDAGKLFKSIGVLTAICQNV